MSSFNMIEKREIGFMREETIPSHQSCETFHLCLFKDFVLFCFAFCCCVCLFIVIKCGKLSVSSQGLNMCLLISFTLSVLKLKLSPLFELYCKSVHESSLGSSFLHQKNKKWGEDNIFTLIFSKVFPPVYRRRNIFSKAQKLLECFYFLMIKEIFSASFLD